jgi:hypothetical protein
MKHMRLVGAALSALLFSGPVYAQSTFPDVPDNHWAAAAVKKLAEAGIIEGFSNAPRERGASSENAAAKITLNTPVIKTALVNNAALAKCTIDVDSWMPANAKQSVVALRGTVRNAAQKKLAGAIAKKSAPDARILNQLKIADSETAKLKTTKSKIAKSKAAKPHKVVKSAA